MVKCRICGKPLTDPKSIERGIGPECFKEIKQEPIGFKNLVKESEKKKEIKEETIEKPYDSKIPAFNLLANAFDLLADLPKLEELLENLSDKERHFLYTHKILKEYDLLP